MDKAKLLKLAKMVMNFASVATDKAELIYDGELAVGVEVFIEDEAGEMVAAADGEYVAEGKKLTVKEGKIEEIEAIEEPKDEPKDEPKPEELKEDKKECMEEEPKPEPEPQPEPQPDEKDLKIAELEGLLADRDAVIEELTAKIKELEDKVSQPVEEPVKMNRIEKVANDMKNGALKYFQD